MSDTKASKTAVRLHMGGAHRGAEALLPRIADFNNNSSTFTIEPEIVDIAPGRAKSTHALAERLGITGASWQEGSIEAALSRQVTGPVTVHIDSPEGLARALDAARQANTPAFGLLVVRLGNGQLIAIYVAARPTDSTAHDQIQQFLKRLSGVSMRGSHAADVFTGSEVAEQDLRESFAQMLMGELPAIASNSHTHAPPLMLGRPGRPPARLVVLDPSERAREPQSLVTATLDRLPATRRGTDVVVAELVPDAVLLHDVRVRTDTRLAIGNVAVPGQQGALSTPALEAASVEALQRATRLATVTRHDAVATSD